MARSVSKGSSASRPRRKGSKRKSHKRLKAEDKDVEAQSTTKDASQRRQGGRRGRSRGRRPSKDSIPSKGAGGGERSRSRPRRRRVARQASSKSSVSSTSRSPAASKASRGRSRRRRHHQRPQGRRIRESSEPSFLKSVRCPQGKVCRKAHSTDDMGTVMLCDSHHHHFEPSDLAYERRKRLEARRCQNVHSRESVGFITRFCDTHHHHYPEYYLVRRGSAWRLRRGRAELEEREREKWRREAERAMDEYLARREREEGGRWHDRNNFSRSEVAEMLQEEKRRNYRLLRNRRTQMQKHRRHKTPHAKTHKTTHAPTTNTAAPKPSEK